MRSLARGRDASMRNRLVHLVEGNDIVILQARYQYG
jgi:Txe/YoeB family toxin of Txe-Axe toxin-antitoxin module